MLGNDPEHKDTSWVSKAAHYLAALTGDTAVVVAGGFVPTHDAQLVFVQVTRDVPWQRHKEELASATIVYEMISNETGKT